MRAAVLAKAGAPLEVWDDVELAPPGPGQVRVRVSHCGLCHSDLSVCDGSFPAPLPIVLGHEAAGVVSEVGPGVVRVAPGDRVVLSPCPPCGACALCLRGEPSLCTNTTGLFTHARPDGTTGLSRRGEPVWRGLNVAAFAEETVVDERAAVPVPEGVPLELACLVGCAIQTGVGAVLNTARVEEGATVLVLGLGGIGLSVVQGARLAGAARIFASDPVASRREVALRLGATDAADPAAADVAEWVRAETGGLGADYAFEAAGRAALVATGVAAVRNGGTVVCVGAPPVGESITLAPAALFAASGKRLLGTLLGSCNSLRDIPRFVELARAGRLDLAGMVSARRALEEINAALDDMRAGSGVRTVLEVAPG